MPSENAGSRLNETHHALLFATLSKAVVERLGQEAGEAKVRGIVRRYGEERGRRMALRAKANGHALTMFDYLAYIEFKTARGAMDQSIVERNPHARVRVGRCPWHSAWEAHGLMPWGRLYCLEVDEAVVRGFNPQLRIDILGTRPNGAPRCEFLFRDVNATLPRLALLGFRKAVKPGRAAIKPWDYHVGHVLNAFDRELSGLGDAGAEALAAGLGEFARLCGEPARDRAVALRALDFAMP